MQAKVGQLEKGCYSAGADQGAPDAKQRTKIDTVVQQKAKELDSKLILINTAGVEADLKDYTKEHEADFYEAKFVAGDPFKKVALKTMASEPRLDQVTCFQASTHYWSSEGAAQLKGSSFEKGTFLYQHALEYNYFFRLFMKKHATKCSLKHSCTMESSIVRLAQQIDASEGDPFTINDVLQATFWVNSAEEIAAIYDELVGSWDIEMVKVENKMSENKSINLKFIFCKGIVCQAHLRYGEKPAFE